MAKGVGDLHCTIKIDDTGSGKMVELDQSINGVAKGFRLPEDTLKVHFDKGHKYNGAEIILRLDFTLDEAWAIQSKFGDGDEDIVSEEGQRQVFTVFGEKVLMRWNLLDRDGEAIPADSDGMTQIHPQLAEILIEQWKEGISGMSTPLEKPSPEPDMSEVGSIPMEISSNSPESSSTTE